MTDASDPGTIRSVLLEVIDDLMSEHDNLNAPGIIQRASRKLPRQQDMQAERALLASFYELFRTGYLSWGHNLSNPSPPFCHVTALGRRALAQRSRDPANPEGYLAHLRNRAELDPVAASYVAEALNTFNAACFKATAVMVGAAAERLALEVRDALVARLQELGEAVPAGLTDWRLKRVLSTLEATVAARKASVPPALYELFEANWPAITHQIRTARNEAGHPVSVEPVSPEAVHASLLIFPELAALAGQLARWAQNLEAR
jgi:hypothetical protein